MGQYFLVVCKEKRQFLHPPVFGDGLKFLEFAASGAGTMLGLATLLRQSGPGGFGDIEADSPTVAGTWAGKSVTIVGDYDESDLYSTALTKYEDISHPVLAELCCSALIGQEFKRRLQDRLTMLGEAAAWRDEEETKKEFAAIREVLRKGKEAEMRRTEAVDVRGK